jgi:L-Ala-D/L-Glu epimerase
MRVHMEVEKWPLATPFRIAGYTFDAIDTLLLTLEMDGCTGRGEACGVYYKNDKPASMIEQIHAIKREIEVGIHRDAVNALLAPGGARNALDCALWELEAKLRGVSVWQMAGLNGARALLTTFTCGVDEPIKMAEAARGHTGARAIKLKLAGEPIDAERVRAVREALPDVWLAVDANQGFERAALERLLPELQRAGVALIEQPFPVGRDDLLDGFQSPIPIAADESAQNPVDLPGLVGRYDVVNIKLDKCGGLTEGLKMARDALALGLEPMVGNMSGTSLGMAPAMVLGQLCKVVDLDGPVFLNADRPHRVRYVDGFITCPPEVWG